VPHGHGDGKGLPVCLVLHGATARPRDFQPFGLPRFLTAAVRRGAPPFVLMGADGGLLYWERDPGSDDDPERMVLEELPRWAAERGFDAGRVAGWGWSMGAFGVLHIAEVRPGFLRGAAVFSSAVTPGDDVFASIGRLAGTPLGVWCGRDDPLYPNVRQLVAALPEPPRVVAYAPARLLGQRHATGPRARWRRPRVDVTAGAAPGVCRAEPDVLRRRHGRRGAFVGSGTRRAGPAPRRYQRVTQSAVQTHAPE
jgi:predicted esterase